MSVQYGAISWNRQKKVYDLTLVSLLALYLAVFVGVGAWRNPSATAETLLIRALGAAAFLMLNVVLCIGPLSRLDRRFLPLLYNRRHLGVTTVLSLHLAAAFREKRVDRARHQAVDEGFVEVCKVDRIAEKCATIVSLSGERVAVFRYDGKVSAISNVCQHQNGPLGEGRIIDGCVTCPWHGYHYQPESGAAPPPFKEKIPTFRVKVVEGSVFVHPRPNPPGTRVEPARIESTEAQPR